MSLHSYLERAAIAGIAVLCLAGAACAAGSPSADHDPWERFNRAVFRFNDTIDTHALEPAARAWHAALPDPAERAVGRFFDNLRAPLDVANNLLQGKVEGALAALGRFFINSTLGAAGFLDPATHAGLVSQREDFGQTLARWGVGSGPYLVLPFLGPSTVRDAAGMVPDAFGHPWTYFVDSWVVAAAGGVYALNTRASLLDQVARTKRTALDYYAAVRNAYLQHRQAEIADRPEEARQEEEDLYYIDFDDEE